MQVSVCLGAILIPEYLDSIPEYILIPEYSQTNAPLVSLLIRLKKWGKFVKLIACSVVMQNQLHLNTRMKTAEPRVVSVQ